MDGCCTFATLESKLQALLFLCFVAKHLFENPSAYASLALTEVSLLKRRPSAREDGGVSGVSSSCATGIIQHVVSCAWLLLVHVSSSSVHAVACIRTSLLLTAEESSIEQIGPITLIQASVHGHLGCFHLLASLAGNPRASPPSGAHLPRLGARRDGP